MKSAAVTNAHHTPVLPPNYKDYDTSLVCSIPNGVGVESFDWIDPLIDNPMVVKDGSAYLHQQPGWEFNFIDEFLEDTTKCFSGFDKIVLKSILLLISLLSSFLVSTAQTKYYVSTTGNDKNNGSIGKPFVSVNHAIRKAAATKADVVIEIRKGVYYLDKTIGIDAGNFLPTSLLVRPYQNDPVTISGGRKLSLEWKPYKGKIFVAKVPPNLSFERLFVNGRLQVLARYPNYDSVARVFHGTAADAIAPERVKRWKNPEGGYIHALHPGEWGGFDYRFTGVDTNGKLQMEGGWQNNRPNKMHDQLRFVENIFEELDAPGEWFLNRKENLLYYYPLQNTNLQKATIEVSNLTESFSLKGTMQKPLKNIIFSGLRFTHNERSFMKTKEPLLRSDWAIYRGGALLLDGTENCKITDCVFEGLGGNAIMFSNYNKKDVVTGCHIHHIGANAIAFIGDMKAVRTPSFGYENYVPYEELDKTPGPLSNNFPQQCLVDNNLLHDLGEIEKQATGVEIEVASQITISRNSIYNLPRAGINIGDGCFGGHLIEYNDVFNTVKETGDHGSFNSWGRDRYWAPDRKYMDSLVAVHPELILLDAQKTTIIHNNRWRCDHGWDVDLDDGSSNYYIYNNLFLNGGLKFREGFYRKAENNIMINNTFHPHVWFKNSFDVFEHNIVMKQYAPIEVNYWGKAIDSNIFTTEAALENSRKNGTDKNSIAADPMFINPVKGDFRVQPESPALKMGFKNFPMDQFGVQKPSLKKIALEPETPVITTDEENSHNIQPVAFLGGTIKSVNGLGERSAYGLPDETGVIVTSAGHGLLSQSGLLTKDVIRMIGEKKVKNVKEFLDAYESLKNFSATITLSIMRGQQLMDISLKTK